MDKRLPLKMNLQLFAEETEKTEETEIKTENEFKPIESQSELDSHIGKAVQTALSNQQKKHQKAIDEAVQEALNREKDYSKLTEEERKKRELDDERAQFEKERADFEYQKLVNDVSADLLKEEIPVDFAPWLAVKGDIDKSLENVRIFKDKYDESVSQGVQKALRQKEPRYSGGNTNVQLQQNYGEQLANRTGAMARKKPF
ncbi:DUF4355 domain-containing protein [Aerococcaceae bacterium WGS1372]